MTKEKKVLVSGVKPTGRPHIGNYFGAIKQFVEMQKDYDSYVFIADLHALTSGVSGDNLANDSVDIAIDYLAIGLDPKHTALFKQSDLPEVTELTWILNCLISVPYLMRSHAYKDALVKGKEINVGTFDYPVLMASDILIHDAEIVPVGLDQKQHLEIAKDLAIKFNRLYGEEFKLPEPLIVPAVQVVPGTDGRKMSKSYKNIIELFSSDEEIKDAVMKIPTDSKGINEPKEPTTDNVLSLHKLFSEENEFEDIKERYKKGGISYRESKEILIKKIIKFISPLREKRTKIAKEKNKVLEILRDGAMRARTRAKKKMQSVRERVGLLTK